MLVAPHRRPRAPARRNIKPSAIATPPKWSSLGRHRCCVLLLHQATRPSEAAVTAVAFGSPAAARLPSLSHQRHTARQNNRMSLVFDSKPSEEGIAPRLTEVGTLPRDRGSLLPLFGSRRSGTSIELAPRRGPRTASYRSWDAAVRLLRLHAFRYFTLVESTCCTCPTNATYCPSNTIDVVGLRLKALRKRDRAASYRSWDAASRSRLSLLPLFGSRRSGTPINPS